MSVVVAFLFLAFVSTGLCREPHCSKFHYEEQLLEKMVRTEIKVERMETEIKNTLGLVETALDRLNTKMEEYETRFQQHQRDLSAEIAMQSAAVQSLKDASAQPGIAFNAYQLEDLNVNTDKTLIFIKTIFNIGDGYDTVSGRFTAPVDGIYMFSAYLCTARNKYIHVAIVREDTVLLKGSQHENSNYLCGSATVVALVNTGETVRVKCTADHSFDNEMTQGGHNMNTFTGTLIRKL